MNSDRAENLDEVIELLRKNVQDEASLTDAEKQHLTETSVVPDSLIKALQDFDFSTSDSSFDDAPYAEPEIIAQNYVTLSQFAIRQLGLENVRRLRAVYSEGCFVIYALTPEHVKLDFDQYTTSDYPANRELLFEAEALQGDLFEIEPSGEVHREIIRRIEGATL